MHIEVASTKLPAGNCGNVAMVPALDTGLAAHGLAACVVSEDEKQGDSGGNRYGQAGEKPAQQRRGNDDGAQPLSAPSFHDFLSN